MSGAEPDCRFVRNLRGIVGRRHVITGRKATERYRRGFRSGEGEAEAVIRPGDLIELWRVLKCCVAADRIVIMQAANTGLTEGSTPSGTYDRPVILINTRRIDRIDLIKGGRQVVSFPGATLFALEDLLRPLGREPHSVIGSSCIGASIVGGVCNNSGGALVERGPAYTEMALFARVDAHGKLELVNHLGIELGNEPEEMLARLQSGGYRVDDCPGEARASSSDYPARLRDTQADTPARFNADPLGLYEASGCAGKLAVFGVRLDTFPMPKRLQTFYIGTNEAATLARLRLTLLSRLSALPVSAEYMHRDAFDLSARYGKDTVLMIDRLGTARLPSFFALKGAFDARIKSIPFAPRNLSDRVLQWVSDRWPTILPARLREWRDRYRHHLILQMKDDGIGEARALLDGFFADGGDGAFFECDPREAKMAALNRFAAAGAAVRYQAVHSQQCEGVLALDIALRRNDSTWFEELPDHIADRLEKRLYYGHFLCHVLHQDYVVRKGEDIAAIKRDMLELLDQRGVQYPAEHNVGHLYEAKPALAEFYRQLDPTNSLNPGIGKMSKKRDYC